MPEAIDCYEFDLPSRADDRGATLDQRRSILGLVQWCGWHVFGPGGWQVDPVMSLRLCEAMAAREAAAAQSGAGA